MIGYEIPDESTGSIGVLQGLSTPTAWNLVRLPVAHRETVRQELPVVGFSGTVGCCD
jgi:hypothetical protein